MFFCVLPNKKKNKNEEPINELRNKQAEISHENGDVQENRRKRELECRGIRSSIGGTRKDMTSDLCGRGILLFCVCPPFSSGADAELKIQPPSKIFFGKKLRLYTLLLLAGRSMAGIVSFPLQR